MSTLLPVINGEAPSSPPFCTTVVPSIDVSTDGVAPGIANSVIGSSAALNGLLLPSFSGAGLALNP